MSTQKWSADKIIPTDSNYICRITEADFGPSKSSGNPMITINWEIVAPTEVEIGGEMVNVAGVKTQPTYHTSGNSADPEKDTKNKAAIKELFGKFKLDNENINYDNIDAKPFLGLTAFCTVKAKMVEDRKTPTAKQIEDAKKKGTRAEGDVMTNPVTGAKLVKYWPEIGQIFGLAPGGTGQSY